MPGWLGRLLCLLGIHDYRVVDVVMGWGNRAASRNGSAKGVAQCRRADENSGAC